MQVEALHNEKELLQQVADGDSSAYRKIFDHYWDQIYSTAFHFTKKAEVAEDLTQDIFAQLWAKRQALIHVEKFDSFLYISARNLIVDRLRRKEFSGTHNEWIREYFRDAENDPALELEYKEFDTIIQNAINQLTPQQQTAFRLSRIEGLKHDEIAARMGLSKRTVKNHMVHAIQFLRKYLSAYQGNLWIFLWALDFLKKN